MDFVQTALLLERIFSYLPVIIQKPSVIIISIRKLKQSERENHQIESPLMIAVNKKKKVKENLSLWDKGICCTKIMRPHACHC